MLTAAAEMSAAAQQVPEFVEIVALGIVVPGALVLGLRALGGLIDDLFGRDD